MFGKLMKHEWRSTAPTQGILALAAFGAAVLAGIMLRLLFGAEEQLPDALTASLAASMGFMLLAMVGCVAAMSILLLVRFYKHKFTDEGYLTFTLPANSHQIFLSSALNMLIWTAIATAVVLLGFFTFLQIGLSGELPFDPEDLNMIGQELDDLGFKDAMGLQFLISLPYSVVMTMTCITVGAVIAKKHKILAAFGIYYGISYLSGIFSSILSAVLTGSIMNTPFDSVEAEIAAMSNMITTASILWEVALMIGGYLLSTHLMKKKLNLP